MEEQDRDRRDHEKRRQFDQAVQTAAANAAQQVAQIHRRRLVIQTFMAALAISSAVVIIGMIIVSNNNQAFARANAIYDCQLFSDAARSVGDFVNSDAQLRQEQNRKSLTGELIKDFEKIIPKPTLLKAAQAQQAQVAVVIKRWFKDAAQLQHLGGTDCQQHLG